MLPKTSFARRKTLRTILAVTVCCALGAGTALAAPSDTWITAKSKLALLTADGVRGTAVRVDTVNQQVTLQGKVRSAEESAKAESVAKAIEGVTSVRNLLEVVPQQDEKAVQASDDDIETQVNKALQAQTALKDTNVKSVNNGHVVLRGSTKTMTDHLSAIEVATDVTGVRQVTSTNESPDSLADEEIWRERTEKASDSEYGMVDASRDVWITSMSKMRLMADSDTPALDINVDTRNGVVTLFGMVPDEKAKKAAEANVRKVSGIKDVKNELQVVAKAKQPAVKALDDDLQREVEKRFQERATLKDIDIVVENCVARLTGTVPSGTQRLEAAVVARSTPGVCSVKDDLRIKN